MEKTENTLKNPFLDGLEQGWGIPVTNRGGGEDGDHREWGGGGGGGRWDKIRTGHGTSHGDNPCSDLCF